jgi:hypothetical protein
VEEEEAEADEKEQTTTSMVYEKSQGMVDDNEKT